jgi:hypothetical protein
MGGSTYAVLLESCQTGRRDRYTTQITLSYNKYYKTISITLIIVCCIDQNMNEHIYEYVIKQDLK